jgi:hypothetical protein
MLTTLVTAEPSSSLDDEPGHCLEELPGRPWAVRRAAGPAGRPALEIYVADVFVDLLVLPGDWPLCPHLVRGACSATWAGQRYAAAWGILPTAGRGLLVQFRAGRVHTQACLAQPVAVGGVFWFAEVAGRFRYVLAAHTGGQERHGIRPARPC